MEILRVAAVTECGTRILRVIHGRDARATYCYSGEIENRGGFTLTGLVAADCGARCFGDASLRRYCRSELSELFLFCDFEVAASGLFWRMTAASVSGIVEFPPEESSIRPNELTTRPGSATASKTKTIAAATAKITGAPDLDGRLNAPSSGFKIE